MVIIMNQSEWQDNPSSEIEKLSPDEPSDDFLDRDSDGSLVERSDNHLYYYDRVDKQGVLTFNRKLRTLDSDLRSNKERHDMDEARPIIIHVNSPGGLISAGVSALDTILSVESKIVTIVEGCSASAGTFFTVVGDERIIRPHSYMLIHQLSSGFYGNWREIQDKKESLETLMEIIKDVYLEHTNIELEKLEEIMSHDLYFDAETCLDKGLVDEIKTH